MRPSWVVLAEVDANAATRVATEVFRKLRAKTFHPKFDRTPMRWIVSAGKKKTTAIIEPEPGAQGTSDEALAKELSKHCDAPVYSLWTDESTPRVQSFVGGEYVGEISASPDDVAASLGCSFEGMSASRTKPNLEPKRPPEAKRGDRKIGTFTIAQWAHEIACGGDWSVLLDGVSEKTVVAILDAARSGDAEARRVALRMLDVLGKTDLGAHYEEALALRQKRK